MPPVVHTVPGLNGYFSAPAHSWLRWVSSLQQKFRARGGKSLSKLYLLKLKYRFGSLLLFYLSISMLCRFVLPRHCISKGNVVLFICSPAFI